MTPEQMELAFGVVMNVLARFETFLEFQLDVNELPIEFNTVDQFISYQIARFNSDGTWDITESIYDILAETCKQHKPFKALIESIG